MPKNWTSEMMETRRLVRYRDLKPCLNAFVDTYTPGSDKKENFTIIGPGVAEHPDQYVHIAEAHGFNIGGARQPPGCLNSQHSHETEEVFIVHSGSWSFNLGEKGEDGSIVLEKGDCITIPVNVFRGFENVGENEGYLFAVLGSDDPGHVTWAPDVFDKAKDYGLVLLESGRLVDTRNGEVIPEDEQPMLPTSPDQVAQHRLMSGEEVAACVSRAAEQNAIAGSGLSRSSQGVTESPIIGTANEAEGIGPGKMTWDHGFNVRRLDFESNAELAMNSRQEEEVLYMHEGELSFVWQSGELLLEPGDTLTVPKGLPRQFKNNGDKASIAYVVRGGDQPSGAGIQKGAFAA